LRLPSPRRPFSRLRVLVRVRASSPGRLRAIRPRRGPLRQRRRIGRVFWRHANDTDELLITSPLGQGIARLNRKGDQFRLVTGDRKEYRADNAEDLTEQALGWRLPLAGLSDWVQARRAPAGPRRFEAK